MLAVSTSPRILLEFGNSNREEWLDWNVQCTTSEIEATERWREREVSTVVAVDENEEGMVGRGGLPGTRFGDGVGR
jgi:hypothetical protein